MTDESPPVETEEIEVENIGRSNRIFPLADRKTMAVIKPGIKKTIKVFPSVAKKIRAMAAHPTSGIRVEGIRGSSPSGSRNPEEPEEISVS